LPEAQKYCTVDFEYTLAKGRSRYVCIRNLINLVQDNASEELPLNTDLLFDEPPNQYQLVSKSLACAGWRLYA
jgi:ATP-dependent DNA helicase DinG